MKIVGPIIILLLCTIFVPEISFAQMKCKGEVYSRLDDGEAAAERIEFVPNNFQNTYASQNNDGPFVFVADKKDDEWTYVRVYDKYELLSARGYKNITGQFQYDDMRFDRSSLLKFTENSIIGFNIVCKM